jgi:sarcosine oxidase
MAAFDVIVVGVGAMGSSTLYQLSRRGLRVLGLEAFEPGHRLGSSHGESRVIRLAYYEHPDYVPLLRRAYALWSELEEESSDDLLHVTGGLMIGRPDSELVLGARTSAEQHGLEFRLLGRDDVLTQYPALHLQEDEVALWEPRAGYLRPERCIDAFVRLAGGAHARVHYGEAVRSWHDSGDGVVVRAAGGEYTADRVVFTCGARIAKLLGASVTPVQAERIPLFWMLPADPELFAAERLPIYLWEIATGDHFYGFPHVEWPGVKVARHHSGEMCDPDEVDRTVNANDEARLRAVIGPRIPSLNGPVVESLVCMYENSPDRHFLIDHVPEHPRVLFAGGFSGHGFKFASVVGEILADLVTTGRTTSDADFLRLDRLVNLGTA